MKVTVVRTLTTNNDVTGRRMETFEIVRNGKGTGLFLTIDSKQSHVTTIPQARMDIEFDFEALLELDNNTDPNTDPEPTTES